MVTEGSTAGIRLHSTVTDGWGGQHRLAPTNKLPSSPQWQQHQYQQKLIVAIGVTVVVLAATLKLQPKAHNYSPFPMLALCVSMQSSHFPQLGRSYAHKWHQK